MDGLISRFGQSFLPALLPEQARSEVLAECNKVVVELLQLDDQN